MAILPIGERWLLISVLAAKSSPRVVLVVLIAAGGLAAAYMLVAQARRSTGAGVAERENVLTVAPGRRIRTDPVRPPKMTTVLP